MFNYDKLDLPIVRVQSQKYNNQIYKTWETKLTSENEEILFLIGVFEKEVKHSHLGIIRRGTISFEYYWKNLWFNVFEFHEPEGGLRNFYCNVNQPPKYEKNILSYIDLEIDVLVLPDLTFQTLDLDEFETSSQKHNYSIEIIEQAQKALDQVMPMIERTAFPFDTSFSKSFFERFL